jgi:hypothetical protein
MIKAIKEDDDEFLEVEKGVNHEIIVKENGIEECLILECTSKKLCL